jgi:intracellular sulfur oxidation DsrE/DsrF family protein
MADKNIVIVFKSDGMGVTGNRELREVLARKFLALIADADTLPGAVCFYTDGVKLVCEGSPLLAELAALEQRGVHLVICKTCLDTFGLAGRVRVGIVGGMTDILEAQLRASKVITI